LLTLVHLVKEKQPEWLKDYLERKQDAEFRGKEFTELPPQNYIQDEERVEFQFLAQRILR